MNNIISSLWLPYNREMLLHSFLDEGMETNNGKGSCLSSQSLQLAVSRFKPASLNSIALALFFLRFFFNGDNFKVFIEFVTILLLFCVLLFWPWGRWISAAWLGIEIALLALEGEVLTTRSPGKSLIFLKWEVLLEPWTRVEIEC